MLAAFEDSGCSRYVRINFRDFALSNNVINIHESLTVIGRQLINCTFARGRRCTQLIIRYGRHYLERTCVECGNGGWLEETMQQMRRAVIKKAPSIIRKLKEDSENTR